MSASNYKPRTLDGFLDELARAAGLFLMLDYDGTLAPFHISRSAAVQDQEIADHLDVLQQIPCVRVVIVSGRPLEDLQPLLKSKIMPELYGSHGVEYLDAQGCRHEHRQPQQVEEFLQKEISWCRDHLQRERYEIKPFGIAVHWRGLTKNEISGLSALMKQHWSSFEKSPVMRVTEFNGGLELRPRGTGKGSVVRRELERIPDNYAVAYVGDDWTDEEAFEALGERGIKVLIRYDERPTKADVYLDGYQQLPSLLGKMTHVLKRHSRG